MALVFYHRGLKLRPEIHEFRLGIQKAQEAIDNSVGCKSTAILFPDHAVQSKLSHRKSVVTSISLRPRKSDWSLERVLSSSLHKFLTSSSSSDSTVTNKKSSETGKFSCNLSL